MNNAYYKLYLKDVLALAKTLRIKFSDAASTLNQELVAVGVDVDESQPRSWKYYRHLAGEYHPTDTKMMVRSVDTLETIEFSKENLAIHRATAREYQYGSRFYNDLVRQYPNQVLLIQGILSPVAFETAYEARDGQILFYDSARVESNEVNLINRLQSWIYSFMARWYNSKYILTDDLYLPGFIGQLYLQLPSKIQLIRLRNAKTQWAHSFHIREYLASNGRLDEFLPFLNNEQQLFLYRNLRYIQLNVGKQEIFNLLVKKMLTDRGLPLAGYQLQHNIENLPAEIRPDVEMGKIPINFGFNQTGIDTQSVHTILTRERPNARDNYSVEEDAEPAIIQATQGSLFNRLPTKVLESEIIDRTNSSVRSMSHVLLNEWLYLCTHDRYNTYIDIPDPSTGENMNVTVRDAFVIAIYAFLRSSDLDVPETIPSVVAYEVLRHPLPNYKELQALVDPKLVSPALIAAVQDRISPLGDYISTAAFYEACDTLHDEYLRLWELYSLQEHFLARGYLQSVVKCHFQNVRCDLVDEPMTFEEFFRSKGIAITDLNRVDYEVLYLDCVSIATGSNLVNRRTLAELQRAMIELMTRLSSYTVQYLRTISTGDFWYVGTPSIRLGDTSAHHDTWSRVPLSRISVLREQADSAKTYRIKGEWVTPPIAASMGTRGHLTYDPNVPIRLAPQSLATVKVNTACVGLRSFQADFHQPPPDTDLDQYRYPSEE